MKVVLIILIVVHGLIHLLGFVKGFGLADIKELTLNISRRSAIAWLLCAVLFLLFAGATLTGNMYAWTVGFAAVIFSQILIIISWKDAKYGTIPNIIILIVSLSQMGTFRFEQMVQTETRRVVAESNINEARIIAENNIDNLPEPVRKWLITSGQLGKPEIKLATIYQNVSLKMKPGQDDWLEAESVQYSSTEKPAFIWTVDMEMLPMVYMTGRDKYIDGKGEMLIKVNDLVNAVEAGGDKMDEGSLQRYLAEMVWMPSLALSPYITWQAVDSLSATALMSYMGTTGSGTFHFDQDGNFRQFTTLRYMGNEPDAERLPWIIDAKEYKEFSGIKIPSTLSVSWQLREGTWTWLVMELTSVKYN